MKNAKLVIANVEYLHSYLDACRERKAQNGFIDDFFHDPEKFDEWKDNIFTIYENNRVGRNLPEGYVPSSDFWLVEDGNLIGVGSVRHSLTPSLEQFGGHISYAIRPSKWNLGYGTLQLKLLLHEAFKLGIYNALVTCDEDNIGSYSVIAKNGGAYQDTMDNLIDGKHRMTKRYWIDTTP